MASSSIELQRGVDVSRDVVLDVTLTCSTLQGSAHGPVRAAGGGTAANGSDYVSTPGMALLTLTDLGRWCAAPVQAVVHIDVLDNGENCRPDHDAEHRSY